MAERIQTAPEAGNDMGNDDAIGGNVSKYMVLPAGYCGLPKKGHLIFDACFESGNLGRVDQVSEFEYDLFIRPDTCNPRFRVWFNFTVENVKESQISDFSSTKMAEQMLFCWISLQLVPSLPCHLLSPQQVVRTMTGPLILQSCETKGLSQHQQVNQTCTR